MDPVRRAGPGFDSALCEYDRFHVQWGCVTDLLLIGVGAAVISDGAGCRSILGLLQRSTSLFVGCIDRERSHVDRRRGDDLRQLVDDDHQLLGAIWDRLVFGAMKCCISSLGRQPSPSSLSSTSALDIQYPGLLGLAPGAKAADGEP